MGLDINLTHLRYFLDSVRMGSLVAAAKANSVTHSTISQGIKRLEESLGIELIIHKKRTFSLTENGKFLLPYCNEIIIPISNLEKQIKVAKKNLVGEVLLASSQSIISNILFEKFNLFKKDHKYTHFNFEIGRTQQIKNWVQDRAVEFGITLDDENLDGVEKIYLRKGSFILISKKKISLNKNNHFLLTKSRPETIAFKNILNKKVKEEGVTFQEIDSWGLIREMVYNSDGVGLVPDFVWEKCPKKLYGEKLSSIKYQLVLIHRKNEILSPVSENFLELLKVHL